MWARLLSSGRAAAALVWAGLTSSCAAGFEETGARCRAGACDVEVGWSSAFRADQDDAFTGVTIDASGRLHLIGYATQLGTLSGDPLRQNELPTFGDRDALVAELAGDGSYVNAQRYGSPSFDQGIAVLVHDDGRRTTLMEAGDTLDMGDGQLSAPALGGGDVVLSQRDAAGDMVWNRTVGGDGYDEGDALAAGPDGTLVLLAGFRGTGSFGGAPVTSQQRDGAPSRDVAIAMYAGDGGHLWTHTFGNHEDDRAHDLVVDRQGNVFVAGEVRGAIDVGGVTVTSQSDEDALLASFSASGALRWAKRLGGQWNDEARAVGVDAAGNVYVGGSFALTIELGGTVFATSGGDMLTHDRTADLFLASFTGDGDLRWARQLGGAGELSLDDLVVDATGTVYVAGHHSGPIDLGTGVLQDGGLSQGVFVASFSDTGAPVWSTSLLTTLPWSKGHLAVSSDGAVFVAGEFSGYLQAGDRLYEAQGRDPFVVQLLPVRR